ncbi:MAG TPA: hypothetical protein VF094_04995 [Gaiellaceae bacterium]
MGSVPRVGTSGGGNDGSLEPPAAGGRGPRVGTFGGHVRREVLA